MKKAIAIIGAGLVGTLSAIYFAKRGYSVSLYERRPDPRKQTVERGRSINLALSHRGIAALKKVNLDTRVLQEAVPVYGRAVHAADDQVSFQAYSFHANEFNYSVSREGLNKLLLEALQQYPKVNLVFDTTMALADIAKTELVIIADGAASHIRRELVNQHLTLCQEVNSDQGYKELMIAPEQAKSLSLNHLHIWPRHDFMLIALPNFDGSFTCTLFMPVDDFSSINDEKKIATFFKTHFPQIQTLIPDYLVQYQHNPVGLLKTTASNPWFIDGRFLLIGDAAHAIVPFLGQGMNCGFEDCEILDNLLDQYSDDSNQAFQHFSENRKIDTDAIATLSLGNYLEMRHKVVDPDYLQKRAIESELVKKYPDKYRPIYELISYTSMPYSKILQLKKHREKLLQRLVRQQNRSHR